MFRRFLSGFLALVLYFYAPVYSYAITVTSFNGAANSALGSLVGGKLGYLGESAAISRTLASMGGRVAALGSACGATGPGSALCMVAGGIATGVVTCAAMWETGCRQTLEWAYDKSISFAFGTNGTVTASGTGMSSGIAPVYSNGTTSGAYCWTAWEGCWGSYQEAWAYSINKTMTTYPRATYNQPSFNQVNASQVDATYTYSIPEIYLNNQTTTKTITRSVANKDCASGTGIVNGVCTANGIANTVLGQPVPYTSAAKSPAAVVADLPDNAANKPASNEAIAAAANALWKAAAAADSAAASWTQARAITAADVEAWRAANAASVPTVGDMAKPLAPDTINPASFPYTSPTSGTGTGTNTGTGTGTGTNTGTGSSSWLCGIAGLPACNVAVDTTGIDSKTFDMAGPTTALDTANKNVVDALKGSMPTAPNWSWTLPIQSVACSPLNLNVMGRPWVINWCPYIPVLQQAISFLAYCFTALHLFGVVMRPSKRA